MSWAPTRLAVVSDRRARHHRRRAQRHAPSSSAAARTAVTWGQRHHRGHRRNTRRGDARRRPVRARSPPTPSSTSTRAGNPFEPRITHIDWDMDVAEKGGYPDFMLKEIHEQPRVIRDTLAGRLVNGALSIDELDLSYGGAQPHRPRVRDRLRHVVSRRPHREEPHRRVGAHPLRGGGRQRVPLPQPHHHADDAGRGGVASRARPPTRSPPSATRACSGAKVFGITNVVGSPHGARERTASSTPRRTRRSPWRRRSRFWARWCRLRFWRCCWRRSKGKLSARTRCAFCSASWPTPPSRSSASSPSADLSVDARGAWHARTRHERAVHRARHGRRHRARRARSSSRRSATCTPRRIPPAR